MSKVILIFVAFLTLISAALTLTAMFYFPNSLEIMKTEIIETGTKNGFETKIETAEFRFPNIVEFGNISVGDFAKNIKADAKSFELEISYYDYIKALYKRKIKKEKIGISGFSNSAKLKNIAFFVNDKEIFHNAKANLYFENESIKYDLSTNKIADFHFPIKEFLAHGSIDSGICIINSTLKILDGSVKIKGECSLQNYLLRNIEIELGGIEIKNLLPEADVSGKISGKLIPEGPLDVKSDWDQILKKNRALCSLQIDHFKYSNQKHLRPILGAVSFLGINNLDFSKVSANFDYSYSKVSVNNFLADNFKYSVSANGYYMSQNQKIDFGITLHFNPDMKFVIQKEIWKSMTPDHPKNEGRKLSGRVSGNLDNYSISLDSDVMKRGVNSLLRSLEKLF